VNSGGGNVCGFRDAHQGRAVGVGNHPCRRLARSNPELEAAKRRLAWFKKKTQVKPEVKEEDNAALLAQAGAVANAVWHATGIRLRRFPIRIEDLVTAAAI
jgi:hypothetical protein